jgi:hypothetical protein
MIRKLFWSGFSVIVLVFFCQPAFSFIEGPASGGMTSVLTSGPSDASRNPALMPLQKDSFDLLIAATSGQHFSFDFRSHSYKYTSPPNFYSTTRKSDFSFYNFSAPVGFSWKGERSGFGMILSSIDGSQYSKTKMKMSGGYTDYSAINGESQNESTFREYHPALNTSWGIRTGDTSSFGVRLRGSFNYKTQESHDVVTGTFTDSTTWKRTTAITNGSLGFGFHYEKDGVEAGAIISTPTFANCYEKFSGKDPSGSDSARSRKSFIPITGSEITLGFSYPVINGISLFFEFSGISPMSYKIDDFKYDSSSSTAFKQSVEYEGNYNYTSHLGFKISTGILRIVLGVSGILEEKGTHFKPPGGAEESSLERNLGLAESIGFELDLAERVSLGISGTNTYYRSTTSQEYPDGRSRNKFNVDKVDLLAGVMLRF